MFTKKCGSCWLSVNNYLCIDCWVLPAEQWQAELFNIPHVIHAREYHRLAHPSIFKLTKNMPWYILFSLPREQSINHNSGGKKATKVKKKKGENVQSFTKGNLVDKSRNYKSLALDQNITLIIFMLSYIKMWPLKLLTLKGSHLWKK